MIATPQRGIGIASTWRLVMWGTILAFLAAPLVAMRFTTEVMWDAADFVAAAVLLVGVGAIVEITLRVSRRATTRVVAIGVALTVAVLIWTDAAVGVF